MDDLGAPASYLTLETGVPVYSCDSKKVGKVKRVLYEPDADIFDGLVLDTSVLPGGESFVKAEQVEEIFERGVLLKLDHDAVDSLPEPA